MGGPLYIFRQSRHQMLTPDAYNDAKGASYPLVRDKDETCVKAPLALPKRCPPLTSNQSWLSTCLMLTMFSDYSLPKPPIGSFLSQSFINLSSTPLTFLQCKCKSILIKLTGKSTNGCRFHSWIDTCPD